MSVNDEIKKIILENPTLPLKFFVSEDANSGEYYSVQAEPTSVNIQDLTLYNDMWCDNEEDLEEEIYTSLFDGNRTEKEIENLIKEKLKEIKWEKFIVINL